LQPEKRRFVRRIQKKARKNISLKILDECCHGPANGKLNGLSSCLVRVRITRPKEAFQPVLSPPRHNVHVKVRHALADAIVHRYEGPVGFHCGFDSAREELGSLEKRSNQIFRQIGQSFVVLFGDQQAMPRENGPMIEKGQQDFVLEYYPRRYLAGGYLAKQTRGCV